MNFKVKVKKIHFIALLAVLLLNGCFETPINTTTSLEKQYGFSFFDKDSDLGQISGQLARPVAKGYIPDGELILQWTYLDNQQNHIMVNDGLRERILRPAPFINAGIGPNDYYFYLYPVDSIIPFGVTHISLYLRTPEGNNTLQASFPLSVINEYSQQPAPATTRYAPAHLAYFPVTPWLLHNKNKLSVSDNVVIEAVQIQLSDKQVNNNKLNIKLTSPTGTQAVLFNHSPLLSYDFYAEQSQGEWNISITDETSGEKLILEPWSIRFYGNHEHKK